MQCPYCKAETAWDYDSFSCQSCGKTIPEPPDLYDSSISETLERTAIRRILAYEKEKGYDDRAVLGGMLGFAQVWRKEVDQQLPASESKIVKYIATLLSEYHGLNEQSRQDVIESILYTLDHNGAIQTTQGHLIQRPDQSEIEPSPQAIRIYAHYAYGHKGLDHYARFFAKGRELVGNLIIDPQQGVFFASTNTWTPQRVRIPWNNVENLTGSVSSGCLFFWKPRASSVKINYKNQQGNPFELVFFVEQPTELVSMLEGMFTNYKEQQERKERLYREFIAARQLHEIPPQRFEVLVRDLFEKMGYRSSLTKQSADGGVDLVLYREGEKCIVQCKRYKGRVSEPLLRDLAGTMLHENASKGYLVTTGEFSGPARKWAVGKNIVLVDKYKLAQWIKDYVD